MLAFMDISPNHSVELALPHQLLTPDHYDHEVTMFINESPGQRLKRIRTEQGVTQEELAEKAVVSLHTLMRIESGQSRPISPFLEKIAGALGVTPLHIQRGFDGPLDEVTVFALEQFPTQPEERAAFEALAARAKFRNGNLNQTELQILLEEYLS